MFRQDIQCFDYGFHPSCYMLSNYRNIFYYDCSNRNSASSSAAQESDKVSILTSSQLSKYDLSFNKISCVKRLRDGLRFAYIDE